MKKQEWLALISLLLILFQCESGFSQNVNLEYFSQEFQPILQEVPSGNATKIFMKDSIESNCKNDTIEGYPYRYRYRGYLVPPEDGYYKFYLMSSGGSFYLSLDSMEYHKRLAITSYMVFSSWLDWPANLSERYNSYSTYAIDSIYLYQSKPYYFEIIQSGWDAWSSHNYFGLKWVLPGDKKLQTIKENAIKPAAPKPVRSDVDYDIFENQSESDFATLKSKPFPNQRLNLHSLSADNIPQGLDNFSSRIRGYIIPPYTGNYSFYLASDDASQFWLSSDSSEYNIQLKSNILTTQTDWKQNTSSQELISGQKYFFEVLHHNSTGNSTIKLGWAIAGDTVPEIIGYSNLMGYIDNVVPSKVSLNEHQKYLQREQSFTLLTEVYPWNTINKKVRWRSTNPSVATVNRNGLVHTVQLGGCQIIAQCDADTTVADTLSLNVNRIEWELFKNRTTYNFDSLRNSAELPDQVVEIVELNTPDYLSTLDNYSSRIRGYLLPPVTGEYSFYFACDDAGQFWLSPDSIQSNAQLKSEIDTVTNDWSKHVSVQTLIAGHKYFFELLHHESVYKDNIKLGWIIPGDTVPVVIHTPFIAGSEGNAPVSTFSLLDRKIVAYPNWTLSPRLSLIPWNATDKMILWESSNIAVASVSANGEITTIGAGECNIYARVINTALADTLQLTVSNYYGPYFVKQNADINGDGHSWNNAIGLNKLLDLLNQGTLSQKVNVYVAQGTYKPTTTLDRNKTFLLENLRIVGGFSGVIAGMDTIGRDYITYETIFSGEIGIPGETMDNSYHVVVTRGNSIIDGVTIRDGRANSFIYGGGIYNSSDENHGGGIFCAGLNTKILNSRIINNSALDAGAGIYSTGGLDMENCLISGNLIQQNVVNSGSMFTIVTNGYGAGLVNLYGTCNLKDCILNKNSTPWGYGKALYIVSSVANVHNCSIFDNQGYYEDLWINGSSTLNMTNSTLAGRFVTAANSNSNILNSTIIGGGYTAFDGNHLLFDNSIWSAPNLKFYDGTTSNSWQAKYSILGDSLFGVNNDNLVSVNIQNYAVWLDTLSNNGGPTPTMRLKNISGNPAKSKGNPLYLGTADQRGAIRTDSVSIGAYQWVKATSLSVNQHQVSVCPGDSLAFNVSYLPLNVSDSSYSVHSSDISIVRVTRSKIFALAPGKVNIIVHMEDGGLTDTCKVEVQGAVGTGTITGSSSVFPGQKTVNYTLTPIDNANSYIWTLPEGATGSSTSNTISIDFGESAGSCEIKVRGKNDCGEGEEVLFNFRFYGSEPRIYVSPDGSGLKDGTDWNNALDGNTPAGNGYTLLSDLMRWSKSGTQFWIAEGTYKACTDNDREKSFELGQGIRLYGGFVGTESDTIQRNIASHPAIFSGNIGLENDSTDNTKTILKTASVDWNTYSFIDGIDFIGGYNETTNSRGAGILNYGYISLKNSSFFNNFCSNEGGGLYSGNRILIEKCLFANNNAGWGGGMLNRGIADIRSSKFIGNSASYGGGISTIAGANMTLINSLVVNNSGRDGGGISTFSPWGGSTSVIINSTIANNSGSNVVLWWSNLKVYNSIIYGGGGVSDWYYSTTDFKNSIIQDNVGNPTIYDINPKFICPTRGVGLIFNRLDANWGILGDSPAIDKGEDSLIPEGVLTDYADNPRIHFNKVDLGAYERQTPRIAGEACLNNQGVNVEYFNNPRLSLEMAPTDSALSIVPISSLGSDDEGVGNNNFRIRGYLLPPETGYYKFYFAAFNWSSFYLSRDSMEYHRKLAISGCCTAYSPWPLTVSEKNSPNMTYYIDSVLLNKNQKYYFEILGSVFPNMSGKGGIRWTLPGSNVYRPIPSENLQQPSPRKLRSNVDWNIYKNKFSFDPEGLKKNDPVPDQKISVDSLKTNNYAGALNNFTSRIRGYIVPTVSGEYNFYFSSYDSGQFWLSSDSLEVNAQLKSNLNEGQSDWLQNVSSQSLVAEQRYYFEILYHDVSGDDGIKLGWAVKGDSLPEVISSHFLLGELTGIKPTSVKLQDEKLYLQKNHADSPGYQIYPWNTTDKRLIWKSSDPSVASIDQNGLINPIHGGECRIILLSAADTTLSDTLSICVTKVELEMFKNNFTYDFAQLKESSQVPDEIIDIESLNRSNIITFDYFSSRIRGYLIPPVSGDYSFYFACNDVGQFWLSSDSTTVNARLMSEISTIQDDWTQNVSNQTLVAGQKYYFEILHHEQTYTDLLKLGWKIPGHDSPEVIATPYMNGWNGSMPVNKLLFVNHQILSFPKCTLTPQYELKPWNASNKRIEWQSTNSEVASVNADGLITMINPGECKIIATILGDKNLGDTLQVTVTDYYGPYFVKENAMPNGKGHSWDDAIGITKLFDFLNLAQQDQRITVLVAKGTYLPTEGLDRTKSFILNNVRMVGGFSPSSIGTDTLSRDFLSNETILSGDIGVHDDAIDNSFHVVATRGNSVLDGLSVRDGKASVSEYGFESGVSYGKRDDNGGGILSESGNTCLVNCRISNNSAINGGGGLAGGGNITIKNCSVYNNGTSPITYGGGMFTLQVNGYGGGISIRSGSVSINGSVFHDNGATSGGAIYLQWSSANIENSAFYNNGGSESIKANFGCSVTMNNTTLKGSILGDLNPSMDIKNSTIVGNLLVGHCTAKDAINLDNTIITNYDGETVRNSNYTVLSDSTHKASYCLLGHSFFGVDKTNKISSSIPDYNIWLDTIAYNGGSTPTMKLKNIAGNPAIRNGNPACLGATDQRGAIRTGSVSIGAYQLVNATEISISPKQATLCSSGSAPFNVSFLPAFAIDSTYFCISSEESVATISGNTILAHSPGKASIIVHSADGTLTDTCKVEVRGAIGSGTITGPSKVFPGQKSVSYTVTPIDNATSFIWTLPAGATGSSTENTISIDFGDNTDSGEIKVRGVNDCGEGEDILFNFSFYDSGPRIYVTPDGAGLKDGSDWINSLDGNTPAGNGYTRLSDLMRWSKSGTQFWIAEGTYKTCNDNDREKSFELGQGIRLYGGFVGTESDTIQRDIANHPTIFSGDIGQENDSTDNTKVILKTALGDWSLYSFIDGIGFVNAFNSQANSLGVGIYNTGFLSLINCRFLKNQSYGEGAGINNHNTLLVDKCLFVNNRTKEGGGIYNSGTATIKSSIFSNNSAEYQGGGIGNRGGLVVVNSLIVNNSGGNAGGISSWFGASTNIYNSTLANNTGEIMIFWGQVTIYNSIVWGGGIALWSNPTVNFSHSIIQNYTESPIVFNTNPLFIKPSMGLGANYNGLIANWGLRMCSPVLDMGDNSLISVGDSLDLNRSRRIINGTVDPGAIEFDPAIVSQYNVSFSSNRIYISSEDSILGDGLSWSSTLAGNLESCKYLGQTILYEVMKDAKPGTEIWIKKGVYKNSLIKDRKHAFTIGNGVIVHGGFHGNETSVIQRNTIFDRTVFSGNIGDTLVSTDNSYHVLNINPGEIAYADTALLDGVIIEQGYADGGGSDSQGAGILIHTKSLIKLTDIEISKNKAWGEGAGIKIANSSRVQLINSRIIDNEQGVTELWGQKSSSNGGGIFNRGNLKLFDCQINNNSNATRGSGIYNVDSLEIYNTTIDNNLNLLTNSNPSSMGGGIYNLGFCKFSKGSVSGNLAYSYGGGVCNAAGGRLYFEDVIVADNSCSDTAWGVAGGTNNDGSMQLLRCQIRNNLAWNGGGGIFNSSEGNSIIRQSTVSYNKTKAVSVPGGGGGILNGGQLTVDGCLISNNETAGNGGGLFNPTKVLNCVVVNNKVGSPWYQYFGGGIYIGNSCQGIINSTVINNDGRGIYSASNDSVLIKNSIIYNNDNRSNGFLKEGEVDGKFTITNSCIKDYSDLTSSNISDKPLLKNPSAGTGIEYDGLAADWSLLSCSPCVNAGDNSVINYIDTLDSKGQTRLKFAKIDIGATESQEANFELIDYSKGIVYVSESYSPNGLGTSWTEALSGNAPSCRYPDHSLLYQALKDVPQNCKIWLQGGIYPTALDGDRNKSFELKQYTQLFGGFAGNETSVDQRVSETNETILSGNIGNPTDSLDNSYHVIVLSQFSKPIEDTLLIDRVTIYAGQADGTGDNSIGGGVLTNKNSLVKLRSCKINSNGSGGGYYNRGRTFFENCEISQNASFNMGGGIYNDDSIGLKNCRVINNHLSFPGGGFWETWGGAGIFNASDRIITIDSSQISNNNIITTLSGAGIMNHGSVSITSSKIENNKTDRYGGGIYSTGRLSLTDCKINNNFSSNGAVATSGEGEIRRCSFENNKAGIFYLGFSQTGSPAAIANSGNLKIRSSVFRNNVSNGNGGAIQNSGNVLVDSTLFEYNNSGVLPPWQTGMFNIKVIGPGLRGGAISNSVGNCIVLNSIFKENQASYGGALSNTSGKMSINNCKLIQNFANSSGGVLMNHGQMNLTNCLIANNNSENVITVGKGSFTKLKNCNYVNNTGGFLVTGLDEYNINHWDPTLTKDTVIFENSIIWGNETTITNSNSSLITMNYTNSDVLIPGKGNINSDPLFVNPTAGNDTTYNALEADWTLSACSPAVNAGNDSIATDSLDLAGNARKFNRVDMGAYEMKFDNSIIGLTDVNTRHNAATIQWSRSVNPCNTILFMKDTIVGTPSPVAGTSYSPDSLYSAGALLDGWHCIYKGNHSEVSVTGLTQGTTYRIAAFNYYPENSYGAPVLKNFKTVSPSVSITPQQVSLCPDASQNVEIAIVPVSAEDSSYTVSSSDESIASITGKTIYAHSPGKVNVIVRSGDGTLTDTCTVEVRGAIGTGTITGPSTVCQGQNSVTYSVSEIENSTSYLWSLPAEVTGTATTNTITVDFGSSAVSGNISVRGHNTCGDGKATILAITINPKPLPPVLETVIQPDCFVATGSAGLSGLPESGAWSLAFTPGRATTGGSGASVSIEGLDPDTYTFKVTDSNGCVSAPSDEVVINTQPAPNQNKQLNVRVFLEGVFDPQTGLMKTTLRDNALIPKSQPYTGPPWNYSGTELVSSVPSGVVDWVLVELRQAATPTDALPATKLQGWPRAYFLRSDGAIVDLDGASFPTMGNPSVSGNLYVIVRHRNHLAIMSSVGINSACDNFSYDFTDGLPKAHGSAGGYRQIVAGVYGMVSGDANSNGDISVLDFTRWATDYGQTGIYFTSDINGDGQVSVLDFTKWATNFGMDNISPLKGLNLQGTEGQSPLRYRSQVPGN